jgi:asparaginyl-tRNA synthetase
MSNTAPIATIASLSAHEGQTVTLRGWLYNLRASGKLLFPIFRDGTGTIQGIVPKAAVPEEVFNTLKNLTLESSVIVTGKVRADSRAPSGYELDVENVEVVQRVPEETPFPITLKEHGVDFLMEHRHLWLRTPRQSAILRVRATIMRAAAEYFDTNGFVRTDPPILTPNACEGTSELFEMDYFDDDKAYLTQSGQLYIEATALALGKVYSFGPTFRAEKSKTRRHLTEFWMIEPEVAYAGLDDIMDLAEAFITHIVARVLEHHRDDLKVIGRDVTKLEAVVASTPSSSSSLATPIVAPLSSFTSVLPSPLSIFAESRQVDDESASLSRSTEPGAPSSPAHLRDKVGGAITEFRFPRLSYDEAHAMLDEAYKSGKLENPHRYGDDFGSPDETYISSQFDRPASPASACIPSYGRPRALVINSSSTA